MVDNKWPSEGFPLSGLIRLNRAMLTKLRLRQKRKSVSVLHGELKFLELLLALRNLKSIFKSARCANFEPC